MTEIADSIPSWSADALFSRDVFFRQFNDVNFYVEDEDQENLYLEILNKLFDFVKIDQIFPLGGKANVIAHAVDLSNSHLGKSVYIVDKDFDDLLGNKVCKSNVFYLSKYCIENFLVEKHALLEVAVEAQPKRKRDELLNELMIDEFLSEEISKLDSLFRMFFIVQRFDLGIKNCDQSPECFSIKGKPHKVDVGKIDAYRIELTSKIINKGFVKSEAEVNNLIDNAYQNSLATERDSHISGKFILAMLMHFIKNKIKCGNVSLESFAFRLAKNSKLENLHGVRDEILSYLKSADPVHS